MGFTSTMIEMVSAPYKAARTCDPLGKAGVLYHKLSTLRQRALKRSRQYYPETPGYDSLVMYAVLFDSMQTQLTLQCNLPRKVCIRTAAEGAAQDCAPPGDPAVIAASGKEHRGIHGHLYPDSKFSLSLERPTFVPATRCDDLYPGRSYVRAKKRAECQERLNRKYQGLTPLTQNEILDRIWEVGSKLSGLQHRMYKDGDFPREIVYGPRKRSSNAE